MPAKTTNLDALNELDSMAGGAGGHLTNLAALNSLSGGSYATNLDALNSLAGGGHQTNLAALNSIESSRGGGTGNHTTNLDALNSIIALGGFAQPFDPMSLNPYLLLDARSGVQKASGGSAGYFDQVSSVANPGTGSDPAQSTSSAQPRYLAHTGRNYLHLPGITGNTLTVAITNGTYDYLITYADDTTASGTVTASGGIATFGPTGTNFVTKQVWRIDLSSGGTQVAAFRADSIAHGGLSFVDSFTRSWTINQSGTNPASLIGTPVIRFDGAGHFLSGTFASAINGGRMFAVFRVLGTPAANGRFFDCGTLSGHGSAAGGIIFGRHDTTGNLATYFDGADRVVHTGGMSGRLLNEVWTTPTSITSRRNNADEKVYTGSTTSLALERFALCSRAGGGANPLALDISFAALAPPTTTDAQAAQMRQWINTQFNLGLTL